MKLINKISQYFLLSSIVIFIIISGVLYLVIEKTITAETDEQLTLVTKQTHKQIRSGEIINASPFMEIEIVDQPKKRSEFKDVFINTEPQDEAEPFRQLTTYLTADGINYRVIARVSLIEKGELLATISAITISIFLLFVVVIFFTNKIVSKKILNEFKDTLRKLEDFSLKNESAMKLRKSDIEEFDQLNKAILYLAENAQGEYRHLKEFTEEMNHELQTPIAIVKSKLELLVQGEFENEKMKLISSAQNNIYKLENLSKSILLLNKLDYKELFKIEEEDLEKEVNNILTNYEDFIQSRNLELKISEIEKTMIKMNPGLLNILLNNIISNSIRHNISQGRIEVACKNYQLRIVNTAVNNNADVSKYFQRFYKETKTDNAIGLGLTITEKICKMYNIKIENYYKNGEYGINLNFKNIAK